ncbi:hypothetical protein MUP65_02215 [Patescibacteria group bacterium]|nr:hypothetical protein [Patescibacteria group bacterium]
MIGRKDKFIIFLALSLTLLALLIKSAPFKFYSVTTVLGRSSENWQIDQEQAVLIANKQKEVKQSLRRGEIRQETDEKITIHQPELVLKAPPSIEDPSWTFELIKRTIVIPKTGQPTEETEVVQVVSIDAYTGKVF